jgi:hypothetical protein
MKMALRALQQFVADILQTQTELSSMRLASLCATPPGISVIQSPSHGSGPSVSRVMGKARRYQAQQTTHSPESLRWQPDSPRNPTFFPRAAPQLMAEQATSRDDMETPATSSGRSAPMVV